MKFARLFELKDESQVLLTIEENEDSEDKMDVVIRTDFESFSAKIALTFEDEETARKQLNTYTQKKAESFREKMSEYA